MKNKLYKIFALIPCVATGILMFLIVFFVSSCEDEDNMPVITNVRLLDPDFADISQESSTLGTWIVIQGKNLKPITAILFNYYPAEFNPALFSNSNLVVQISDETPTGATHADSLVPDKIHVVTPAGIAEYDFATYPPPPIVSKISNEFEKAGNTIILSGRYYYFIDSIVFPGGVQASTFAAASDGNSCEVTVPDGITEGGSIKVYSKSGLNTYENNPTFNDTSMVFASFSDPLQQGTTEDAQVTNETLNPPIPNCVGNYLNVLKFTITMGTYWIPETALETHIGGAYQRLTYSDSIPITTPASQLVLRFEIYTKRPWYSGEYEMAFLPNDVDWKDAYRFYWSPWEEEEDGEYTSDGWKTISLPLSEFKVTEPTNVAQDKPLGFYGDIMDHAFNINFKNNTEEAGHQPIDRLHLAFDNFRIIKIR